MKTHVFDVDTQVQDNAKGKPTGVFRYRWHCSCGRVGPWKTGSAASGAHATAATSARIGGQRHVAAMERAR